MNLSRERGKVKYGEGEGGTCMRALRMDGWMDFNSVDLPCFIYLCIPLSFACAEGRGGRGRGKQEME